MNNIKMLRIKKNMTQGELATQVHVTQTSVSQWESGKTNPDTQTSKNSRNFLMSQLTICSGNRKITGEYITQTT